MVHKCANYSLFGPCLPFVPQHFLSPCSWVWWASSWAQPRELIAGWEERLFTILSPWYFPAWHCISDHSKFRECFPPCLKLFWHAYKTSWQPYSISLVVVRTPSCCLCLFLVLFLTLLFSKLSLFNPSRENCAYNRVRIIKRG